MFKTICVILLFALMIGGVNAKRNIFDNADEFYDSCISLNNYLSDTENSADLVDKNKYKGIKNDYYKCALSLVTVIDTINILHKAKYLNHNEKSKLNCFSNTPYSIRELSNKIVKYLDKNPIYKTGDVEAAIIAFLIDYECPNEKSVSRSKKNISIKNPAIEFIDGHKLKYKTNGTDKAKGISFSIEYPKSWVAEEGKRPNIVQRFIDKDKNDAVQLMVLITDNSTQNGRKITDTDILDYMSPKNIRKYLPKNSTLIDKGKLTLENLPGFWMRYNQSGSRLGFLFELESIAYTLYYKNKIIQIIGSVAMSVDGKPLDVGDLNKYQQLFELMVNSLVIENMYNQ